MGDERLCSCGSAADWAEVGSTWMCVACRDRDVDKNIGELREALARLDRAEKSLRMLNVDTASIAELLGKLEGEINGIVV